MNNNSVKKNKTAKSRRRPALALLLVLFIAAAFFLMSDIGFVKNARDSLMGRLGYVSEEETDRQAEIVEQAEKEGHEQGDNEPVAAPLEDSGKYSGNNQNDADGDIDVREMLKDADDIDALDPENLPEYAGKRYLTINGNVPDFPEDVYKKAGLVKSGDKLTTQGNLFGTVDSNKLKPYEFYNDLDKHGRTQTAYGCIGRDTMPADGEERGDISSIHPSGWAKAQNWERCHLIAWSLSAENANPGNLITGTHYLNYDSMRPLEEETSHYIWSTGNHVLYMSEPVYKGDELVARGVHMVARSVEDNGAGLSFNVYCFNVTPGAAIDYNTGIATTSEQAAQDARLYVINKRSKVFHYPSCDGAKEMSEHNREEVTATRKELTSQGYTPCGSCEP